MQSEARLPRIRDDLEVVIVESDGADKTVILRDPLQQRTFALDPQAARLLLLWQDADTVGELRARATASNLHVSDEDIQKIIQHMIASALVETTSGEELSGRANALAAARRPLLTLFIRRQHILNPRPFSLWLVDKLRALQTRRMGALVAIVLAVTALLLAAKINQLTASRPSFTASWILMIIAIWAFSKTIHELGHAFAATRSGAMVLSAGVMWYGPVPVPYTDVSDIWRIRSKLDKVIVGVAGVAAEFGVAVIAALIWALDLSEVISQICKYFITVALITTVVYNFNPFIKSDGYYIISDLIGRKALRLDAMTELLRIVLTTLRVRTAPTRLGIGARVTLAGYAALCIAWRLLVVAALARIGQFVLASDVLLAVWVAGLILFVLLLPTWLEVAAAYRSLNPARSRTSRLYKALGLLVCIGVLAFPVGRNFSGPAVLTSDPETSIFTGPAGRVVTPAPAAYQRLAAGDGVIRLGQAELGVAIRNAEALIAGLQGAVNAQKSIGAQAEAQRLEADLQEARAKLWAHEQLSSQLVLEAPHAGVFVPGEAATNAEFLPAAGQIGWLVTETRVVFVLLEASDQRHLRPGDPVTFLDRSGLGSVSARVESVAELTSDKIPFEEFSELWGGPVPVTGGQATARTLKTHALVKATVVAAPGGAPRLRLVGAGIVYTERRSVAALLVENANVLASRLFYMLVG